MKLSKAVQSLLTVFVKVVILKRIDIIYFEEIGMISAEQFAALDLILPKVSDNYLPFGGVLVFGTCVPELIPPPQGRLL